MASNTRSLTEDGPPFGDLPSGDAVDAGLLGDAGSRNLGGLEVCEHALGAFYCLVSQLH